MIDDSTAAIKRENTQRPVLTGYGEDKLIRGAVDEFQQPLFGTICWNAGYKTLVRSTFVNCKIQQNPDAVKGTIS